MIGSCPKISGRQARTSPSPVSPVPLLFIGNYSSLSIKHCLFRENDSSIPRNSPSNTVQCIRVRWSLCHTFRTALCIPWDSLLSDRWLLVITSGKNRINSSPCVRCRGRSWLFLSSLAKAAIHTGTSTLARHNHSAIEPISKRAPKIQFKVNTFWGQNPGFGRVHKCCLCGWF